MNRIITVTISLALIGMAFVLGLKAGSIAQADTAPWPTPVPKSQEWNPPQLDPEQWAVFHKTPPPGQ